MLNKQTYFKPTGFYKEKQQNMSGRGQGNKSRKRDLIDAPKITSAPAKIANKGNLPKKLKADVKKSSRSTQTPTPPPVVHDELSSSDESEAEEQQNRSVDSSSDDGGYEPIKRKYQSLKVLVMMMMKEGMRKKKTFHGNVAFLSLSNSTPRFLTKQVQDTKRKI